MRRFTVTALTPRRLRRIALGATGLAVGAATLAAASPERDARAAGTMWQAPTPAAS
jgi:hypothetical protein